MTGKHVIIIPLMHDLDWTSDTQRQAAIQLKRIGLEVVVLRLHETPIRWKDVLRLHNWIVQVDEGLTSIGLVEPLPFIRFKIICALNRKIALWLVKVGIKLKFGLNIRFIWWLSKPLMVADLHLIESKSSIIVYDCFDNFIVDRDRVRKDYKKQEIFLLKQALLVVAISPRLYDRLKKIRKDVMYVPQGYREDELLADEHVKAPVIKKGNRPLIGYIGGINDRLDFELLDTLIVNNPGWDFVFWGPEQNQFLDANSNKMKLWIRIKTRNNVSRGEAYKKIGLVGIVRQFDVAILPYDTSMQFNQDCFPEKAGEYIFCQKQMVSSYIQSLEAYGLWVNYAKNPDEWRKQITRLLQKEIPSYKPDQLISFSKRYRQIWDQVNVKLKEKF